MREKSYMGVDLGQGGKGVEFTEGVQVKETAKKQTCRPEIGTEKTRIGKEQVKEKYIGK